MSAQRNNNNRKNNGKETYRGKAYNKDRKNNCKVKSEDIEVSPRAKSTTDNDVSWYAKNPQLLKDSASINTTNVGGYPIDFRAANGYGPNVTYSASTGAVPGIITINIVPSIGAYADIPRTGNINYATGTETSAVNLAAKNIYSYVRHANSGSSNYDSPDLMCGILAADQVFSAIALAIRAYGIAMNYDQKNRYTPIALLTAMGFSPESVIADMARFRYLINNIIARASVIWVPSDMDIVSRHYWMYTNVYRDSEDAKAQYYMYVPEGFYKFDGTASTRGSMLTPVIWGNATTHTIDQWYKMVSDMLDPIISDEDMGIMFGDMLKAYGKENLFSLDMIPDNYTILPVHNKEVLYQIHNANTTPVSISDIRQVNNVLYQEFGELDRANSREYSGLLNYWESNPEPGTVMVSTRLKSYSRNAKSIVSGDQTKTYAGVVCGSEYAKQYRAFWYADGTLVNSEFFTFTNSSNMAFYAILSKFDWCPAVYSTTYTAGSTYAEDKWNIDGVFIDLDNYTTLPQSVLDKMHTTALFSEFGVPKEV